MVICVVVILWEYHVNPKYAFLVQKIRKLIHATILDTWYLQFLSHVDHILILQHLSHLMMKTKLWSTKAFIGHQSTARSGNGTKRFIDGQCTP